MQYPAYSFVQSDDATQFFFKSIGPKGVIQKIIVLSLVDDSVYNLALGDYDHLTGKIDDQSVSDNGDTAKILATIVQVIHHYLTHNPQGRIAFAGNTPARNRLYRMAISRAYPELSALFYLFGYKTDAGSPEPFDPSSDYELYLIGRK
ncbi:DUF6934 family protein [Spirosoma montaniterrae]|uniref:Uncharacterized protein n=1 Tax=Spirosoma montaniterrae TaxID=1178516 RepID=A0A1P9X2W3_9BACT|nr:hypothetical protein [Spirosoma montaniterrae]AQG81967.1 hypothetical protein AWR27_23310 [Spirosoma montaniterrae]